MEEPTVQLLKVTLPIKGTEAVVNVSGDWHYGVRGIEKDDILSSLNRTVDKYKGDVFRILTGDLMENSLQSSVGHNYDIAVPDPSDQKKAVIDILKKSNKHLYGESAWKRLRTNKSSGIKSVSVEGNHELRTRKLTGQWLAEEYSKPAKVKWLGMSSIIELTIINRRLKLSKTYKIFVAHRPSKTNATSYQAILGGFKKKQQAFPGIDLIVFGHFHKRFISAGGYFDTHSSKFKKVLYVLNPSPMANMEYAEEAGYAPIEVGHHVNIFLPLDKDKQPYGIV